MIRLIDEPPREDVLAQLREWQREVDVIPDFGERVEQAGKRFKQRNRAENKTFAAVRGALRAMCGDAEWCCYCECSQAAEIDHVRPKSLYPGAVFVWANFLWVCGRCNRFKLDGFAIVEGSQLRHVPRRKQGQPAVPPPDGDPALIDLRTEDPLEFLWLDLYTFELCPAFALSGLELERARYTIDTLRLNEDALALQRHRSCRIFAYELRAYVEATRRGADRRERDACQARVRREPHKIVWESMKQDRSDLDASIAELFEQAPEARQW